MDEHDTIPRPRRTADFWGNADRCNGDQTPCDRCGRAVRVPAGWVHVVDGGGFIARPGSRNHGADGGDCGCWPVGRECAKYYPAAFLINPADMA